MVQRKFIVNKSINITLNSRPPHLNRRVQPYLLQYTSVYLHQQQIELPNQETQKANHMDQDQPGKQKNVNSVKSVFSLY